MNASEDITAAENVLRDLISVVLAAEFGIDWLESSGLTPDRLARMRERLEVEVASRPGGATETRLIYYSDLTDLKTIIDKNWVHFKPCLGDKKTFDVNLDRLIDFRTAEMHGRELLPFEASLTRGISGELRNRVTIFRSEGGPSREYFPRIEYVRDSFGNLRQGHGSEYQSDRTNLIVHPGEEITFDLHAWDPDGVGFTWSVQISGTALGVPAPTAGKFVWRIRVQDISDPCSVVFILKSDRPYHRSASFDDTVRFSYRVLPGQ